MDRGTRSNDLGRYDAFIGYRPSYRLIAIMRSREKELWMVAFQIEQAGGADYIARRQKHFEDLGEEAGAALWRAIASKYEAVNQG